MLELQWFITHAAARATVQCWLDSKLIMADQFELEERKRDFEAGFFSLPVHDVVFPHVFVHLDVLEVWRCREVCSRFLALCNEYFRVTPSLDLRPYRDQLQHYTRTFLHMLHATEQLQRFYLRGVNCATVLPATLAERHQALVTALISRQTPAPLSNLRVLSLENVDLHQAHNCMRQLARHCTQLKELTLSSVVPFDDESLGLVTQDCKGLERLTLRNVPIRGHSLLKLASQCPNLKCLGVSLISRLYIGGKTNNNSKKTSQ